MTRITRKRAPWQIPVLLCCAVLLPPVSSLGEPEFKSHDTLFALSFPTEEDGWACGRFGTILHTSDGGQGLMVGCGDEGSIYRKPPGSVWRRVAY